MLGARNNCLIGLLVLLAGCATLTPETLSDMSDTELCVRYGNLRNTVYTNNILVLRDEIKRRGFIRKDFYDAINNGQVQVGMTQDEALCTWGAPNKVNSTETRYGASHQWVYETYLGRTTGSIWRFVYVEDGKVTAVQH